MNRSGVLRSSMALLFLTLAASTLSAQMVPRTRPISERAFRHPDLFVPERTEALKDMDSTVAAGLRPELAKFGAAEESVFYDARVGRWSSLILKQPLLPGTGSGNRLSWGAHAPKNDADLSAQVWTALHAYLQTHQGELKIDLNELVAAPRVAIYDKGNLIFVYVPRVVGGIPVRDNSIGAAINHGNLILLGMQKWGDVSAASTPSVSAASARDAVRTYLGSTATAAFTRDAHLEFIPMANGDALYYRLAWSVSCKIPGDMGSWEALVDASNGTLFAFEDQNQYGQAAKAAQGGVSGTGVIAGGVYPISNDQFLPGGIEQPSWPMSFVDYTIDGVKSYTDVGGERRLHPGIDLDRARGKVSQDQGRLRRRQRDGLGRHRAAGRRRRRRSRATEDDKRVVVDHQGAVVHEASFTGCTLGMPTHPVVRVVEAISGRRRGSRRAPSPDDAVLRGRVRPGKPGGACGRRLRRCRKPEVDVTPAGFEVLLLCLPLAAAAEWTAGGSGCAVARAAGRLGTAARAEWATQHSGTLARCGVLRVPAAADLLRCLLHRPGRATGTCPADRATGGGAGDVIAAGGRRG